MKAGALCQAIGFAQTPQNIDCGAPINHCLGHYLQLSYSIIESSNENSLHFGQVMITVTPHDVFNPR
jgi:hypothetical protein